PYGPPRRLRGDVTVSVERWRGWPVYTLRPTAGDARGAVVYVHGGAWGNEIVAPHWRLAARIAAEAGAPAAVPVHPLPPSATARDVVPAGADPLPRGRARASHSRRSG